MKFETTPLQGVLILKPQVFSDERGFFLESWNHKTLLDAGHKWDFVQDNHSHSRRGVLRGLHFQSPPSQGKLVRVVSGAVFDVAVDLRRRSPSFGRSFALELRAEQHTMLWIPPGCAHGFYVLSETADVLYKTTAYYSPQNECCLRWDDPVAAVQWPLAKGESPLLSSKDAQGLSWEEIPFYD